MIEQIMPFLYRIEIPLPNNPLKVLNSYLICGPERNLLIDTGFNLDVCKKVLDNALEYLGIRMDNTDILLTHAHSDHAGLIEYYVTPSNTVWIGDEDAKMLEGHIRENLFMTHAANHLYHSGLLASGVPSNPDEEAIVKYAPTRLVKLTILNEGDQINVGNYHFLCLVTPGHTAGHICLYEPGKKVLIAGDHILGKITPNIGLWDFGRDLLGEYLNSLDKIVVLDVDVVLPGHRNIIFNMCERIKEIKEHHFHRLQNVLDIIGTNKMTAAQVASRMKWDLSYKNWRDYPVNQKMHAAAEAMAHLYHLTVIGDLVMTNEKGIYYFCLK